MYVEVVARPGIRESQVFCMPSAVSLEVPRRPQHGSFPDGKEHVPPLHCFLRLRGVVLCLGRPLILMVRSAFGSIDLACSSLGRFWAMRDGSAWQIRHSWQRGICKLQILGTYCGFESHAATRSIKGWRLAVH